MNLINKELVLFTIIVIVSQITGNTSLESETCHSFAGGSVYPQSGSVAEHTLQFTQAVSK